ncbi:MAG: amidase [Candidatus Hydrogenedentales bacterium]
MGRLSEYEQYDAIGLAKLVAQGEVTPAELLEEAIARAEALNPKLNAINLPFYERARERAAGELPRGPLRGVPFLLKDLGTSWQGTHTTWGSALFKDNVADHNSELVRRYENAGLVIFGKTATPEFGLTTSTESRLWGATHNPWNLEHTAGGSSGGTAAAIAAGIVPAADGSDGGGSIRIPAACCGLVGLKPSRGRISHMPDRGESWSGMSTGGCLSRSVRDSALLLDISGGYVGGDPYTAPAPDKPFLRALDSPPPKLRIAFHTTAYNGAETHADCRAAVEDVAALCAELGHAVEERILEPDRQGMARAGRIIVAAHTRRMVDDRLAQLNRTLRDDDLEPLTRATYDSASRYSAADYVFAINALHRAGRDVAAFLTDYDLILTPTMATPPMKLGGPLRLSHPDSKEFSAALAQTVGYTQFYNASGNPAINVPLHWNQAGLPIGVQFAAPYGEDALLLQLAAQLSQARPWGQRRPRI